MRRRPPTDEEEYVEEDDDDGTAPPTLPAEPSPPISPDFLWLAPNAPGASLPDPQPIPGGEMRTPVTPAWRRRWLLTVIGNAAMQLAIFVGIAVVLNAGNLSRVPTVMWVLGIGIAILSLTAGLQRPGATALALDANGITFEHSSYRLKTDWGNVARLVQLGRDETTLALRLAVPAVDWERAGSAQPWRRIPYPWDMTIPLQPFTLGEPERRVQQLVAGAVPALRGVPSSVEAPHAETPGRRAAGFIIGLVPLAVLMVGYSLLLHDSLTTLVLRTLIICGLGAMSLARWNGITGERTADYVARVALGPAREPKTAVVPVLARMYAVYAVFLVLGFALSMSGTSAEDLTAKYGPAHTCWKNDAGKISGCKLSTGVMLGTVGKTQVTCFFHEPLSDTTTFHCKS